ncbi:Uncharacterised protein [Enterobacter cloacae]|nr:Uncharacterised protein [Enterobacter cloacae]
MLMNGHGARRQAILIDFYLFSPVFLLTFNLMFLIVLANFFFVNIFHNCSFGVIAHLSVATFGALPVGKLLNC